ncbi:MAG: hypothetical protein AB7U83_20350 [Vicinamibacterales bacterium]
MIRPVEVHRGFVLIAVLMWLSLLGTLALGVALVTLVEPASSAAAVERVALRRAAESAATLAIADLAARLDWTALPAGGPPSTFTDGSAGVRRLGAVVLDLSAETTRRTCGRLDACDEATTALVSDARPWGGANPRWRLFVHLPLAELDATAGEACPCYLVAWLADDPADADGNPFQDAAPGLPGHGVMLVRGAAFGAGGAVAEVEALVAQPCRLSGAVCPGIRVQSWRPLASGGP